MSSVGSRSLAYADEREEEPPDSTGGGSVRPFVHSPAVVGQRLVAGYEV
ncbi:MAG: hypothetical protein HC884_12685 [Chloroflexaceae bacterium]|nr:hypothetical protein [Chloroflexaceae bacterium]